MRPDPKSFHIAGVHVHRGVAFGPGQEGLLVQHWGFSQADLDQAVAAGTCRLVAQPPTGDAPTGDTPTSDEPGDESADEIAGDVGSTALYQGTAPEGDQEEYVGPGAVAYGSAGHETVSSVYKAVTEKVKVPGVGVSTTNKVKAYFGL